MRSVKAAGRDGGDGSLLSRALGSARRAVQGRDAAIPCPPLHSAEDRRVFAAVSRPGADPLLKRQRGRYYSGGIRLRDPYRADRRFHHPGGASSGPLPLDGPRLAGLARGPRPAAEHRRTAPASGGGLPESPYRADHRLAFLPR